MSIPVLIAALVTMSPSRDGGAQAAPVAPAPRQSPSPASRVRQQQIHDQNLRLQRLEREQRLERYQRRLRHRR